MNLLRFAYYFFLATFAPRYLQAKHDREYAHQRQVADGARDTLWLMGIAPSPYLELRDAEVCTVCRRETWIWFPNDKQCPALPKALVGRKF